jgi:hypothetical protein
MTADLRSARAVPAIARRVPSLWIRIQPLAAKVAFTSVTINGVVCSDRTEKRFGIWQGTPGTAAEYVDI